VTTAIQVLPRPRSGPRRLAARGRAGTAAQQSPGGAGWLESLLDRISQSHPVALTTHATIPEMARPRPPGREHPVHRVVRI